MDIQVERAMLNMCILSLKASILAVNMSSFDHGNIQTPEL